MNLEIQCHLKEAETKDITHVDILGRFRFSLANDHIVLVCRLLIYWCAAFRLVMFINHNSVLILKTG